MDAKTKKILSCNASFYVKSDIDRLYTRHDKGGRCLNSITDEYIAIIISISWNLLEKSPPINIQIWCNCLDCIITSQTRIKN